MRHPKNQVPALAVCNGLAAAVCLALAANAMPPASTNAAAGAGEWTMFRGDPALTGVAGGTVPEKPALLWNFKTGGPVKSSAVIGGGRVFIGSNDGEVYALDFASGRKIWAFKAGSAVLAPPLLADGTIFVGTSEGMFYAIDAQSGQPLWKHETEGKIVASASIASCKGGPLRVLVGSYDFKLYCLAASNGSVAWTYETGNYINGSCAVADGRTVFGGCDAVLHVFRWPMAARSRKSTPAPTLRRPWCWRGIAPISAIMKMNSFAWTSHPARWSGVITTWIFPIWPPPPSRRTA